MFNRQVTVAHHYSIEYVTLQKMAITYLCSWQCLFISGNFKVDFRRDAKTFGW